MRRGRKGAGAAVWATAAATLVLLVAVVGVTVAAAAPSATVGIDKTTVGLTGPVTPGKSFSYQLTASCSSLTVACVNATVTDTLPAGLTVTNLPPSNSLQKVTYDAATRQLTRL